MRTAVAASDTTPLLHLLDEAFCRRSWHGPNLRGSVRNLTAAQAEWRGAHHSIAELTVHCAYWKYAVRRRLRGDKRGSFPLKGSNWFKLPGPLTADAWRGYVRLLEDEHRALCKAVAEFPENKLDQPIGKGGLTPRRLIHGAALHDVYHAGQIQTTKGVRR